MYVNNVLSFSSIFSRFCEAHSVYEKEAETYNLKMSDVLKKYWVKLKKMLRIKITICKTLLTSVQKFC